MGLAPLGEGGFCLGSVEVHILLLVLADVPEEHAVHVVLQHDDHLVVLVPVDAHDGVVARQRSLLDLAPTPR